MLLELCQGRTQHGIIEGTGITLPAMTSSCGRWKIHGTVLTPLAVPLPTSFAHRTSVEERRTVSATSVPLAVFPYK